MPIWPSRWHPERPTPSERPSWSGSPRPAAGCPEHPPRTLYEAIQSTWFTYVALNNEAWGAGPSLSRVDQYLYPFYQADKAAGRITDEDALE